MHDTPLFDLAARQHGLVTDAQAGAVGFSPDALWRRVRSGAWVRVLPGVLRSTATVVSLQQMAMAAVLWAGPDAVASHTTPPACGASTASPTIASR